MNRHGLSIGIERVDNNFFLSLKAVGKLTHEDYKKIKNWDMAAQVYQRAANIITKAEFAIPSLSSGPVGCWFAENDGSCGRRL